MDEDVFYMILGLAMMYSWGHFAFIQHSHIWKNRTQYEKVVTIFAGITFLLFVIGMLSD